MDQLGQYNSLVCLIAINVIALASSAKAAINQILGEVRMQSEEKGIGRFYIAFVLWMYIISSQILSEFPIENLDLIVESIEDEAKNKES